MDKRTSLKRAIEIYMEEVMLMLMRAHSVYHSLKLKCFFVELMVRGPFLYRMSVLKNVHLIQ